MGGAMSWNGEERRSESQFTELALIRQSLDNLSKQVETLVIDLSTKYVPRVEFDPIRRLVYGAVGLVLVAFLVGVVALVWQQAQPAQVIQIVPELVGS